MLIEQVKCCVYNQRLGPFVVFSITRKWHGSGKSRRLHFVFKLKITHQRLVRYQTENMRIGDCNHHLRGQDALNFVL